LHRLLLLLTHQDTKARRLKERMVTEITGTSHKVLLQLLRVLVPSCLGV
jgi:hypothetical protein